MAGPDRPSFHRIVGRSAPMQALFRRIESLAPCDVSVLIQGETGTGKELVARPSSGWAAGPGGRSRWSTVAR